MKLLARVAPKKPQPERPASDFLFQEYNRSIKECVKLGETDYFLSKKTPKV